MTYSDKLRKPAWQKKRLKILERDNWKCRLCDDTETTLHIHHQKYYGNPEDVEDEHLITLCEHCHKAIECFKGVPDSGIKAMKLTIKNNKSSAVVVLFAKEGIRMVEISKRGVEWASSFQYYALEKIIAFAKSNHFL